MTIRGLLNYFSSGQRLTFIGVLLSLAGISIAVYFALYYEKRPKLKYEIFTNAPVLDVREDVGNLDILYFGKSIKKTGQTLQIISVRITNIGNHYISKFDYDQADPLGFRIIGGQMIEKPTLLEASNSYLKSNLELSFSDSQSVVFSDVIIEPKDYFIIKVLVLHDTGLTPTIKTMGKVAGINLIELAETYKEEEKQPSSAPWPDRVLKGATIIISTVAGLYIVVVVLMLVGKRRKEKRKKAVEEFEEEYKGSIPEGIEFIFDAYIDEGRSFFETFNMPLKYKSVFAIQLMQPDLYRNLRGSGFFKVDPPKITVDKKHMQAFNEFVDFIQLRSGSNKSLKSTRSTTS